jgi:hypothetical protein
MSELPSKMNLLYVYSEPLIKMPGKGINYCFLIHSFKSIMKLHMPMTVIKTQSADSSYHCNYQQTQSSHMYPHIVQVTHKTFLDECVFICVSVQKLCARVSRYGTMSVVDSWF